MNLNQLIVKLSIQGVKELEKVVKDLNKAMGGGKPGVPGSSQVGGQATGPATQSKIIKALGAEYQRYADIINKANGTQAAANAAKIRDTKTITDEIKKQVQAIEALEQQANAATSAFDKMLATDKIDEATEAVKKLNEELAQASGGGGGIFDRFKPSGIGGKPTAGGMVGAYGVVTGGLMAAAGVSSFLGQYPEEAARWAIKDLQQRAQRGATWGALMNQAASGDLGAEAQLRDIERGWGSTQMQDQAREFIKNKLSAAKYSKFSEAALATATLKFAQGGTAFSEWATGAGDLGQVAQEAMFEFSSTARQADFARFRALDSFHSNLAYERRKAGFYGNNDVSKESRRLSALYNLDEGAVQGADMALISALGRGHGRLGTALSAISGGMDQGAVLAMLGSGVMGGKLFGAVNRTGFDISAAEKLGQIAANLSGNPLMSLADPTALVQMLGSGMGGMPSDMQNRIAAQNQVGLGAYTGLMTGGDAWGKTSAFINANAAAGGLSFYAKQSLAELANDPNKLSNLQAAVLGGTSYKVSAQMDGLGITGDMAKDWFMRQQQSQMARYMDDPALAGTKAGGHLAKAREAGGWAFYLNSLSSKDKAKAIIESGALVSQATGGIAGLVGGDEAAMALLRVQAPDLLSGKSVAGGGVGKDGLPEGASTEFVRQIKEHTRSLDLHTAALNEDTASRKTSGLDALRQALRRVVGEVLAGDLNSSPVRASWLDVTRVVPGAPGSQAQTSGGRGGHPGQANTP